MPKFHSTRSLANNTNKYSDKISVLSAEEQVQLDKIIGEISHIRNLNMLSEKYLCDTGKNVKYLGLDKIHRFAENSIKFQNFCQNAALPHTKNWSGILKEKGYLHQEVNPLHHSHPVSVCDLFFGGYFLSRSNDADLAHEKLYWLDKACDARFFHALMLKTNRTIEALQQSSADIETQYDQVKTLVEEIVVISTNYGMAGYLHSAWLLLSLGNHYTNVDETEAIVDYCYEAAAESYCCAKVLYDRMHANTFSNRDKKKEAEADENVFTILTKGKGLSAFGMNNISQGEQDFLSMIEDKSKLTLIMAQALKAVRSPTVSIYKA